ncbi:MAG: hypothetical protein HKUEN01_02160 [Candidatus Kuenenia stuttgartiensis]|nr:MAG: hypothetical protein HKUEN01_02160 [Candidatus Kuenenia stuttgartiensis]
MLEKVLTKEKTMNMTTSVDSFDIFKLFSGVVHESTSTDVPPVVVPGIQ